ncbi:MAG: hypothetical protein J6U54_13890 [Clostridiales bacterium]|nr:hypothetical protein [Clostridiales bacterium]
MNKKKIIILAIFVVLFVFLGIKLIMTQKELERKAPVWYGEISQHGFPHEEQAIVCEIQELMSSNEYKNSDLDVRCSSVKSLAYKLSESGTDKYPYSLINSNEIIMDDNEIQFISVNQCHFCIVFSVDDQDYSELLEDRYEFEVNSAEGKTKDILSSDHLEEPDN